jgi:hypothetical protein
MSAEENSSEDRMPGNAKSWRALSNMLDLWALCDRSACRRAQACQGDSRECIPRCGPFVPPDAKEWAVELFACKSEGLSFDEARARLAPELEDAWAAWDMAVRRIAGGRGR